MPRTRRTDLKQLRLLDPVRDVGSDPLRTQRALDAVHRRIASETPDSAPAPDSTTTAAGSGPAARGRVRRLRVGLVAAVALILVLGAVVAVLAIRPRTLTQPTVVPADLTITTTVIGLQPGSGFQVSGIETGTRTQTADITSMDDPSLQARVMVGRTVSRAPTPVAGRAPVDLGHDVTAHWISGNLPGLAGPPQPDVLTWEAAGFTFDVDTSEFGSGTDAIAVARAVRLHAPVPVRIPVTVPALPTGWQLTGLATTDVDAASSRNRFVAVSIAVPGGTRPNGSSPSIDIATRPPGPTGGDETGAAVDIAGRIWRWNTHSDTLTWHGPDRTVIVGPEGSSSPPVVPPATLKAFVAGLSFATSFQDVVTWFDAAAALPS